MMFVTVAEARAHLMLDTMAADGWLTSTIEAVSDAIASWLKEDWRPYAYTLDSSGARIISLDSSGAKIVLPRVKMATLVEVAMQFRFREGAEAAYQAPAHWGHGYVLGAGATSLLVSLRKPSIG